MIIDAKPLSRRRWNFRILRASIIVNVSMRRLVISRLNNSSKPFGQIDLFIISRPGQCYDACE